MVLVDTVMLESIIDGCKKNEQNCQKRLYELYAKQMTAVCFRYTNDYEVARDLMHDGFIKTFANIGNYRGEGSFEGWLRRVFVNISLDYIRQEIKGVGLDKVEFMLDYKSEDDNWDFAQNIDVDMIFNAIKQLPDLGRTIFNMFNLDGYTIKDICKELNMTSEAVRSQHSRAKEKLRNILKNNIN